LTQWVKGSKRSNTLNDLVDQAKAVADEAFENAAAAGNGSERTFDLSAVPGQLEIGGTVDRPGQLNVGTNAVASELRIGAGLAGANQLATGGDLTAGVITVTNTNDSTDTFTFTPGASESLNGLIADINNNMDGLSATLDTGTLVISNLNGDSYDISVANPAGGATNSNALLALDADGPVAAGQPITGSTELEVGSNADIGDIVFTSGSVTSTFDPTNGSTYDDLVDFINTRVDGLNG